MKHLYWHKQQLVMLGPKFRGLPDSHASKPKCLYWLSQLFHSTGHFVEEKQLLTQNLELWRRLDNHFEVATTLEFLSEVNYQLGLCADGIQQAKESLRMFEKLDHTLGQADSLRQLAQLLLQDKQLGAAEEAISKSVNLLLDKGEDFRVCQCYLLLGRICHSKGEIEKATKHFGMALRIASPNWSNLQFWVHYALAELFFDQGMLNDAHAHIECAKLHSANDSYNLGRAMEQQAQFWYEEGKFGEAELEALHAVSEYGKVGAVRDVEDCRSLLQKIEMKMTKLAIH